MMRFVLSLLILVVSSLALGRYSYVSLKRWGMQEVPLYQARVVEIPRGTSLKNLSGSLFKSGVVDNRTKFRIWTRLFSNYSKFQAGKYRFEGNISPKEVAKRIISGDIYIPIVLEFTIPEGFTLKQIFKRLEAKEVGSVGDFEKYAGDIGFLRSLNIDADSLEGYLYPATYQFSD